MISSHSFSWMSSRTASRASMLECTSETIAVRFMTSSRGQRLQHVQLDQMHLLTAGFGHLPHQLSLERQVGRRLRPHAFPEKPSQDPVAAHVDELHLQSVRVKEREDV